MAVNKKLDRRHDINAGERLPERHTRVADEEKYRDNIEAVLKNKAKPKPIKYDVVEKGDIVFVGGHLEEVEEVVDKSRMIVLIRGCRVGSCVKMPNFVQDAWKKAKLELGI